jgi:hypothetical protein
MPIWYDVYGRLRDAMYAAPLQHEDRTTQEQAVRAATDQAVDEFACAIAQDGITANQRTVVLDRIIEKYRAVLLTTGGSNPKLDHE